MNGTDVKLMLSTVPVSRMRRRCTRATWRFHRAAVRMVLRVSIGERAKSDDAKNGCPCKFWFQKYAGKKGAKKEGFSSLDSVATMSESSPRRSNGGGGGGGGGGYEPPISEVGSPVGGKKAGVSPQRGVELMRSESTTHVANPLEPAAPQAAAARLAAPGEAKA